MIIKVKTILILFFLVIFVECQLNSCPDNDTLNLNSDAYQFLHDGDPSKSFWYREWWFFSLYDPLADIGFCIGYAVTDPANVLDLQAAGLGGIFWPSVAKNTSEKAIDIIEPYPYKEFSANNATANVTIGETNFIRVLDQRTYEVVGSTRDERIRWSLTFQQQSYACRQIDQIPDIVQLAWIVYMPSAYVTGTIQFGDKIYSINTTGYHDHNYGAWPTFAFNWIWAQFHRIDKDFSLVLAGFHIPETGDDYIGYVFIRWRGQRLQIGTGCGDYFNIQALEWQFIDGKNYSIHNKIEAWNTKYKIEFEYKRIASSLHPGGTPLGLRVLEQIAQYQAVLYGKNGNNWVILEQNLTGYGFNEWCHSLL